MINLKILSEEFLDQNAKNIEQIAVNNTNKSNRMIRIQK